MKTGIEWQVSNRELSQKLKALNVKRESLYFWAKCQLNEDENGKTKEHWALFSTEGLSNDTIQPITIMPDWYDLEEFDWSETIPAYTVAELGEMLPERVDYQCSTEKKSGYDGFRHLQLTIGRTIYEKGGWYILYSDPHPANKVPIYSAHADTEANARAKMLIYLLENKLITL